MVGRPLHSVLRQRTSAHTLGFLLQILEHTGACAKQGCKDLNETGQSLQVLTMWGVSPTMPPMTMVKSVFRPPSSPD